MLGQEDFMMIQALVRPGVSCEGAALASTCSGSRRRGCAAALRVAVVALASRESNRQVLATGVLNPEPCTLSPCPHAFWS